MGVTPLIQMKSAVSLRNIHSGFFFCAIACIILLSANATHAQNLDVHNKFAGVVVDPTYGQIINIYQNNPGQHLLFSASQTSHTNFYFINDGQPAYYTNNNDDGSSSIGGFFVLNKKIPNWRNNFNAAKVPKVSATLVYYSGDTIIADWSNFNGYDIKQYTYPYLTQTSGQIAIEYHTEKTDPNAQDALAGILLELDIDVPGNGNCNGVSTGGDNAFVLDSREYEAQVIAGGGGACWQPICDSFAIPSRIPQWFIAGNCFDINCYSANNPTALGNLQNPSVISPLSGPLIVPPNEFYIGDWGLNDNAVGMKNVAWVVDTPDFTLGAVSKDMSVTYKWYVDSDTFRCCTTLGGNDFANDNFVCNDKSFFLNIRYPVQLLRNPDGSYNPPVDTIKIWATNVEENGNTQTNVVAALDTVGSCFVLVPGESDTQKVIAVGGGTNRLSKYQTGYCQFLFRTDTSKCCKVGDTTYILDSINVKVLSAQDPGWDGPNCLPFIQMYCNECPIDIIPPLITSNNGTILSYSWNGQDHRKCDVGIDSIYVDPSSTNFVVSRSN